MSSDLLNVKLKHFDEKSSPSYPNRLECNPDT